MQSLLQDIIVTQLFAFMLIFMRLGMALMIMPGIGDSFVSPQVRLHFALAMSFILTPVLAPHLPAMPSQTYMLVMLLISEAFIGIFIGTVMRIMITSLDTAGTIISAQAGFSNASIFNPVTASQGSLVSSLYSMTGVTLLLVANVHHYMLASVVESYTLFPANAGAPDIATMTDIIRMSVSTAFKIGVQLAAPFLVIGVLLQIGFGVLGRLMPQVQIFFIAMPVQILLSLVMLTMVLSAGMVFWLNSFESVVTQAIAP